MATDGTEDAEELIKLAADCSKGPSYLPRPPVVADRKAKPAGRANAEVIELLRRAVELIDQLAAENKRLWLAEALLNHRRRGGRPVT